MASIQELPCQGKPDFTLYDGSHIIIQADEFLPERLSDYLNDTSGDCLTAKPAAEKRLVEIESCDPTVALKLLYANRTLFRYTHRYFVFQEIFEKLEWSAIQSLATRLGIDLSNCQLRLNIYPKAITESVVDLLLEHAKLSPTDYSHILAIIRYTSPENPQQHTYRIGFSPFDSALDHYKAYELLEDESNISRAFYKIQEACERCGVKEWPQPTWNAVDIGASPGGWSLYLSQVVGTVYAVDPADLVVSKPNIIHLKGQLLHVLPQFDNIPVHMIVCDMNDDPDVALKCIEPLARKLQVGGRIIWTLKYPKRAPANIQKRLANDCALFLQLLPYCEVLRTMHLVSNHHERTLVGLKTREYVPETTTEPSQ
jgi:23S rRNA U2552 (ribose-2'-O)-methylase RlmE/FtsJ